jgi:hypothetical protein
MTLSATVLLAVSSLAQTPAPPLPPALPGAAVAPAQPGSGPRILFADTIHDFGTLSAGDVRRCDFVFTNTGNTVLEVTEVRPTCGCTTAAEWSRRVEPGQTGKIPLQLNTANFQGPVVKFVTIVCNDPAQPNHQLQLKANIWKPIDVAPNFVMFNLNNESQTNEVRVVKITNNTPQPIEISPPEVGNPAFRAEIKAIEPGKVFELHIHPTAPFSPGTVQTTITAKTTSTNMPVVTVTALSMVQPPVVAVPQQIYLPPGPLANAMPMTVLIQNNTAEPITISDAAITLENVSVKVTESQPGKVFSLTLAFPQGFELPAGRPGTLTAKTSHPKVPLITVPVVQPPRPNTVFSTPTRTFNAVPPPPEYLRAPPTLPRVPPTPPPTHTHFAQPTPPPMPPPPPAPPTPPPATPPGH